MKLLIGPFRFIPVDINASRAKLLSIGRFVNARDQLGGEVSLARSYLS